MANDDRVSASAAIGADKEAGRIWRGLAATVLLVCVGVRPFVSELPFRVSAVRTVESDDGLSRRLESDGMSPGELSRVILATMLLAACALWIIGSARSGEIRIHHGALGGLIILFGALSALSAMGASNQRAAWTVWIEQVSLLGAGFLAAQLCRDRRMFDMVLILFAALGIALAVKGLYQVAVEFPDNALLLRTQGPRTIRQVGKSPGTVEAEAFRKRLLATTPHGYFSLSNPFASMLAMTAFAGAALATEKIAGARRDRATRRTRRRPGEIPLPALSAVVTTAAVAVVVIVIVLTRSRGAIASAAVMAIVCLAAIRYRRGLAIFRRKVLLVGGAACGACVAALIAYGLACDSLPTRTMTYRWYYWTASAKIIRDNALLGVGPGNFATAYLRNRRVEGEEEIKMPHNAAVHALAQYGLPGGLCYLGLLAWMLVAITHPSQRSEGQSVGAGDFSSRPGWAITTAASLCAGVFLARWFFVGADAGAAVIFMEAVCPAAVLSLALLSAWWCAPQGSCLPGRTARIVLACGLGAFVLHNMVTYSLWMSGAATIFWVGAGACLGAASGGAVLRISKSRWPMATAAAAATVLAAWLFCAPVGGAWLASRSMA
ncbi:MAG: O-antigen ligase family protein, partial [Planctomycetes bacterium]|nr:O-antigen ligase family protein [Planctomycetota bacterium]